jgi:alcohol dehydrogenase
VSVVDVDPPICPDDGVVLDVRATGVCRSDWHAWRGHEPVSLPHVPGHEYAGVIAAVGPSVTRWQVGDRVTVPFVCGCGRCAYCLAGDAQVCPDQRQPGFTDPGSFADQVAVFAADLNVVRLPDALDFVTAAALGCRFATAFRALTAHGRVGPGDQVAVFGCGGVGLSAVMIASALGASVVAVDVSRPALTRATELGATASVQVTVGESAETVAARVEAATAGGAHVGVDALGRPDLLEASVLSLRRRGRHVQVGLLLGADASPPVPMDRVLGWELELHGSHGMAAHEYPAMLSLIASGALDPGRLVGRTIGLDEAGAALAAMDSPAGSGPGMTVIIP